MNAEVFLDTNVLVYAAIGAHSSSAKHQRALDLIGTENFGISAQVLQEFYVTVVKKAQRPISADEALEWIEHLAEFPCQPIDRQLVQIAIEVSQRYRVSYWDGAIIAAAESMGANKLYSEDLNHGQQYGRVKVENPFR